MTFVKVFNDLIVGIKRKPRILVSAKSYQLLVLELLSIFFLSFLSWNYFGLLFAPCLAIILNAIEKLIASKRGPWFVLIHLLLYLSAWHFASLLWMLGIDKGLYGIICNLILYLIPISIYILLRRKGILSILGFIPLFLLFEWAINVSNFSYPWLTIGNVLSNQTYLVQWYEWSGVLGGSLWLLLLSYASIGKLVRPLTSFIIVLCVPIGISLFMFENSDRSTELAINSQTVLTFNGFKKQDSVMADELSFFLMKEIERNNCNITLLPEHTFRGIKRKEIDRNLSLKYLRTLTAKKPNISILVGATMNQGDGVLTNSAILLNQGAMLQKVKRKLVPLNEYLPKSIARLLKKSTFSLDYPDDTDKILEENFRMLPSICYEMFYSFFIADYVKSSNVIYMLSSEKFLNDSNLGKRQYDNIIKLRAIENRVPIVKASNHGSALYIDTKGEVIKSSDLEFSKFSITPSSGKGTFYSIFLKKNLFPFLVLFLLLTCNKVQFILRIK